MLQPATSHSGEVAIAVTNGRADPYAVSQVCCSGEVLGPRSVRLSRNEAQSTLCSNSRLCSMPNVAEHPCCHGLRDFMNWKTRTPSETDTLCGHNLALVFQMVEMCDRDDVGKVALFDGNRHHDCIWHRNWRLTGLVKSIDASVRSGSRSGP